MFVRDPVEHLKEHLLKCQSADPSPADVVYVLKTAAREILPTAGLEKKCAQLEIFADWVVHDEIDRSPAGAAALVKIAEAIPLHGTDVRHDNKWLEEVVNDDLSFWRLRLDLLALCRRFHLPEGMFATQNEWHRFALPLAFEVSGRPVSISPVHGGAIKVARERLAQGPLPPEQRPTNIRVVGETPAKWWWEIKTPTAGIVVQVLFGSFRPIDFPTPPGWASPLA
jgi:hypothetical protein